MEADFQLVSYNVNGLGDDRKRRKIFNFLKKNSTGNSVIFLQETYTTVKSENIFRYQWHGDMLFSHGTSNSRGVAIAFRHSLEYKTLSIPVCDKNGRYIILYAEIQGSPYLLVNCYAPNAEQEQIKTFQEIHNHIKAMELNPDTNFIFGGDWNLVFDIEMDAIGKNRKLKSDSIYHLNKIMADFSLIDIWRVRNPSLRQFTWRRTAPNKQMSRLDFFLVSEELEHCVCF